MSKRRVTLPDDYVEVIRKIGPTTEEGLLTLQLLLEKAGYDLPDEGEMEQEIGP